MASSFVRPDGGLNPQVTHVFKSSSQALLTANDKQAVMLEGARKVLKYMYDLWQNNKLCDVILECSGGQRLFAHKVALGAYSELLSSKFSAYPVTELMTIDVREFSRESVHAILLFVYTTDLALTPANVGEVLTCATELDFAHIRNFCIVYLSGNITILTLFPFMDIAARHRLVDLASRLDLFLSAHFGDVINTDGFLMISGDRLIRLLSEHKVSRKVGELAVFLAVVRWIDYRRAERRPFAPSLFRLINFHLISPKDLINHVEKVQLVTESMECFQMLYTAMSFHAMRMMSLDGDLWAPGGPLAGGGAALPAGASLSTYLAPHPDLSTTAAASQLGTTALFNSNLYSETAGGVDKTWQNSLPPPRPREMHPSQLHHPGGGPAPTVTFAPPTNQPPGILTNNNPPPSILTHSTQPAGILTNATQPAGILTNQSHHTSILTNPTQPAGIFTNPTQPAGILTNPTQPAGILTNPTQPAGILTNPTQPAGILTNPTQPAGILTNQHHTAYTNQNLASNTVSTNPTPVGGTGRVSFLNQHGPGAQSSSHFGATSFSQSTHSALTQHGAGHSTHFAPSATTHYQQQPQQQQQPPPMSGVMVGVGGATTLHPSHPTFTSVAHFTPAGTSGGMLVVVAVGGVELETSDSNIPGRAVYQYNPGSSAWSQLTSLPHNTHHHGVAVLNDKLYVIGGAIYTPNIQGHLGDAIRTVHVFDLQSRSWSRAADMNSARAYLAVCADGTCLYAVGGEDQNRNRLDSIERYDPRFNTWTVVASMPSGGKVGAACTVHANKLYVVGGYNSRRGSLPVMDNVEVLDLATNTWSPKHRLPEPRCHASLVVAMGRLYLIGGRTKSTAHGVASLASVLQYDEARDAWAHVANMGTARHDAGCAAIDSHIYVVGGIRSPSPSCLASVECWDCVSGAWRPGVPSLPYTAAGLDCAVAKI